MEEGITDGYTEIADALRKLEEALYRNTAAVSGHPLPASTMAAHASMTPKELAEVFT
jgi:hypothetical protein